MFGRLLGKGKFMVETKEADRKTKDKKQTGSKGLWAIGLILCLVFGFTLICNCVIIVKGIVSPEQPPSVFGITPMVVMSGSMSGTEEGHIEIGDLILVDKADPEQLEEGDVIAFMQGQTIVTHRIVTIETTAAGERMFYTKGDSNNAMDDEPVREENLVGIYKMRIPKLGDLAMFMQTPLGMILFMGIPLLAFVVLDVTYSRHSAKEDKKKTEALEAEVERLRKLTQEQDEKEESRSE